MCDVEFYDEIGNGRESSDYQTTVTHKGRVKDTVDYVVAKMVDSQRADEITHGLEIQHQFDHENIVHFINWYRMDSKLVIILEYCPGGTLQELLERDVCVPEAVIRIFCNDLMNALVYMHLGGYLFRDFDPRNILLDENGILKLSDFNNACIVDQEHAMTHVRPETLVLLPPELLDNDGIPSYASDFYSLGCLMYRMATSCTPFDSTDQTETIEKIINVDPPPAAMCSKEFNDLVLRMMDKDPYSRPTWPEVVKHPFWKDILGSETFKDIDNKTFPVQRTWEANRPKEANRSKSMRQSLQRKSVSISLRQSLKQSFDVQMMKNESDGLIGASNNQQKSQQINIGHKQSKRRASVESERSTQTAKSQLFSEEGIKELVLKSQLMKPVPIIFNTSIENNTLTCDESASIPIDSKMLHVETAEEFEVVAQKIRSAFENQDRIKTKLPLVNYLLQQMKSVDVANNFASSSIFNELLQIASSTKNSTLASAVLLIYGSVIRYADTIPIQKISEENVIGLESLLYKQESVSHKAAACLGELLTFISNHDSSYRFPSFSAKSVKSLMSNEDETMKHYGIRIVGNLALTNRLTEVFDLSELEQLLFRFNCETSPTMESYSCAITSFYRVAQPSSVEFVSAFAKILMSKASPTLQQLGIILSVETNILEHTKEDIITSFRNSVGEHRVKCMLALTFIFDNSPQDFIEISQRYFSSLDKIQTEASTAHAQITLWSCDYCNDILDKIIAGSTVKYLQIVVNALQTRQFVTKLWTPQFGAKLHKIVKECNFTNENSDLIIQALQQGFQYGIMEPGIIASLSAALNSQFEITRYTTVKLISDYCEGEIPTVLKDFIKNTIIPLAPSLFQDASMIPEYSFKILSRAASSDSNIVNSLSKPNMLKILFSKSSENSAALELSTLIIREGNIPLEKLIQARVIPAIMSVMDSTHGSNKILMEFLIFAQKTLNDCKTTEQRRSVIQSIQNIAAKAPVCAATLLDNPLSPECLVLFIQIFTPQKGQNDILIESLFGPLSISITNGYKKVEYEGALIASLNALTNAVSISQALRLKLKGNNSLMNSIKKAKEQGTVNVREAATLTLKVIKG